MTEGENAQFGYEEAGSQREILSAARGGALKFAGAIIAAVGALVVQLILTRFLGATLFGRYRLAVVFVEILGWVANLGLHSSALRFIPIAARQRDDATLRGIVQITSGLPVLIGFVFGVIAFFAAGPIAAHAFSDPEMEGLIRLLGPAIPLAAFDAEVHGLEGADE